MRTETIELLTQYKDGKTISTQEVQVFARCKSVKRNEFYASYAVGIKPSYTFELSPADYNLGDKIVDGKTYKPTHIRYNSQTYEIVRAYTLNRFALEVTVK